MPESYSSHRGTSPNDKTDSIEDMAARLLAELFYEQAMTEREQKRQREHQEPFDRERNQGLQ